MRTKQEYLEFLNKIKWEKGKEIESYLIPAIDIKVEESQSENNIGTSKFGGNPDLPKDFKWPKYENEYLIELDSYEKSHYSLQLT